MWCQNCRSKNALVNGRQICLKCPESKLPKSKFNINLILSSLLVVFLILLVFTSNLGLNLLKSNNTRPIISTANASAVSSYQVINITAQELSLYSPSKISKPSSNLIPSSSSNDHILVSISQEELWAYDGTNLVYSSPVITGAIKLGDATPIGTWKIYAKYRNVYLKGPTWDDFVQYWMPFYGPYGLHDASWRSSSQFGTQSYPTNGSHGCVELPTNTAAWLYNWTKVGTSVTIES